MRTFLVFIIHMKDFFGNDWLDTFVLSLCTEAKFQILYGFTIIIRHSINEITSFFLAQKLSVRLKENSKSQLIY